MKKTFTLLVGLIMSIAASAQCSDLFISEYVEGSSNNKAIEIYNSSSSSIDLSDYAILRMNNGSIANPDTFYMNGMLASDDVYIIANSNADTNILNVADTTGTATFYNGDDALTLVKISTQTVIDVFGVPGVDPGSAWTWSGGSTANQTLVRTFLTQEGVLLWDTAQWTSFPSNTFSNLGSHSCACYPPSTPEVQFAKDKVWVDENEGTVTIEVSIAAPSASLATSVDVSITGGTAVSGTDFNATSPTTLTFAAGSSTNQTMMITLIDNSTTDADKTIELSLSGLSNHAIFGNDSVMTVTIVNDDYKVSSIADAVMLDADLAPTNEGMKYELTGVVYGIDFDGNNGLSFTIIDDTDGINIFNFNDVSDYVVTEGDEITVRGEIDFYNGLLELFADSIKVNSQGNALNAAIEIEAPGEDYESQFVKLRKVWIADTTTVWPNNQNVWVTNESQDTFQVRIDRDTDIEGIAVAFDTMMIYGIGGQFDNSAPYDEGYQVFPRSIDDIQEYKEPVSVRNITINLNVFPNPTSNTLTVQGNENWKNYAIYNTLGVKVLEGKMNSNSLSVSGLSEGNYVLRVRSSNKSGVSRFIVTK